MTPAAEVAADVNVAADVDVATDVRQMPAVAMAMTDHAMRTDHAVTAVNSAVAVTGATAGMTDAVRTRVGSRGDESRQAHDERRGEGEEGSTFEHSQRPLGSR
jgi:hypothetical protein